MLIDNHGRTIDYIRIALTDKCNLRCFYCMPNEGIQFVKKQELLSYEELIRLLNILSKEGISKVRITGGEPFLRKGIMEFLTKMASIPNIEKIAITTNGTITKQYIPQLLKLGIKDINLSIDSIDKDRFKKITRRDSFQTVWECYEEMVRSKMNVKLNCVVMKDQNIDDIIPLVELTKQSSISVRFIEEMPFNGTGKQGEGLIWNYHKILNHIKENYNSVEKLVDPPNSTSLNYKIEGYSGSFGIIPAYTRSFCGSCNRIRLTPTGTIKTCLYDEGVFNIKSFMRAGASDQDIRNTIFEAIGSRAKDGFEAERKRIIMPNISESMATIGG